MNIKAKCIKKPYFGFVVGKIYKVQKFRKRYYLWDGYVSFSQERFDEHFEEVKE